MRHNVLDVRDQKLSDLTKKNPWDAADKDVFTADYLTIKEYHEMVREGKITKDEFFTAVDELICY